MSESIRFVVFKEGNAWIALGIDRYIVGCAEKIEDLRKELEGQLNDQVQADRDAGDPAFHGFKPFPGHLMATILEDGSVAVDVQPGYLTTKRLRGDAP